MANEQLKNIGYNPEPLKHVVPSIYKSIGSVHSPAKSGSSNHIAAPTFPHIKNDEILSVLIGAVDPNGSWYHKMDNAATCAINRHIEVSKLLDEQD